MKAPNPATQPQTPTGGDATRDAGPQPIEESPRSGMYIANHCCLSCLTPLSEHLSVHQLCEANQQLSAALTEFTIAKRVREVSERFRGSQGYWDSDDVANLLDEILRGPEAP